MIGFKQFAGFAALSFSIVFSAAAQTAPQTLRDCKDVCPEMISVGPGKFVMGETEKEGSIPYVFGPSIMVTKPWASPRHTVSMHKYALGKYPVTRGEFSAFVQESGYEVAKNCLGENEPVKGPRQHDWRSPGFPQTDRDPVVCVSWKDAQAYVAWLSRKAGHAYRLPSEAEWEFAARAGTTTKYYWGNDSEGACKKVNSFDRKNDVFKKQAIPGSTDYDISCIDGHAYTSPVEAFPPNAFGFYDMVGNASEMTQDCWNAMYTGAPNTQAAWQKGKCSDHPIRGGSWYSDAMEIRSAARSFNSETDRLNGMGFRVARDL